MPWIPLSHRSVEVQSALEQLRTQAGGQASVEDLYNEQELGMLGDPELLERIASSRPQEATIESPAVNTKPANTAPLAEGEAFQVKSLRYLRNSADSPDDRRWAEMLHDSLLLELWLQHVTETGDTYYPPLAGDLRESYDLQEGGHHS